MGITRSRRWWYDDSCWYTTAYSLFHSYYDSLLTHTCYTDLEERQHNTFPARRSLAFRPIHIDRPQFGEKNTEGFGRYVYELQSKWFICCSTRGEDKRKKNLQFAYHQFEKCFSAKVARKNDSDFYIYLYIVPYGQNTKSLLHSLNP